VREILLINAFGDDKPGITSAITRILADQGANILDIGQAVIHDTLALGILVELDVPASGREALLAQISNAAASVEIQVRFNTVSEESYQQWVDQQGKPRHIVTLLSRRVTAAQIADLTAITVKHGRALSAQHRRRARSGCYWHRERWPTRCRRWPGRSPWKMASLSLRQLAKTSRRG